MTWYGIARSQSGTIARSQLFAAGLSRDRVDYLVHTGVLAVALPGVYVCTAAPESAWQRYWAAVLWSDGVLSHRSAAHVWRLPMETAAECHVNLRTTRRVRVPAGVVVHRFGVKTTYPAYVRGLPVTDRVTTILDLLRTETRADAQGLLDRSLQVGWISTAHLERAVRTGARTMGNSQLRQLLRAAEPTAHAESERRLHHLLRSADIDGWTAQYRIRLPSGVAVADVAFPEHRLIIEVDGRRFHGATSERFEGDRARQNELVLLGWRVLRVTWAMLRDRPDYVIDRVCRALDRTAH